MASGNDSAHDPSRTVDRATHLARVRERRQQDILDQQRTAGTSVRTQGGPTYHRGKPLPSGVQPGGSQSMRKGYKSLRRSQGPIR